MRKLLAFVALAAFLAVGAACAPVKPGVGNNGTAFENDVHNRVNGARQFWGVHPVPWSNGWADNAQFTADRCPNFGDSGCHNITSQPENIYWQSGGGCSASAQHIVDLWFNSPGHNAFMFDRGWPSKSGAGVGATCHSNGVLTVVWAGG